MTATILLVEDDHWLGECYERWLKGFGYSVRWGRDVQEALDIMDDIKVDVVMLDLMLPFANGIQLLNIMASHGDFMNIPVVVCSSMAPEQSLKPYGVREVLDKATLTSKRLELAIHKALTHATVPK